MAFYSQTIVCLFDKVHVLNDSTLTIVVEFVLDALLLHEAFPVQLALPDRIYLPAPVVNCLHHVIQVLVLHMGLPAFELFLVFLLIMMSCIIVVVLFLDYL